MVIDNGPVMVVAFQRSLKWSTIHIFMKVFQLNQGGNGPKVTRPWSFFVANLDNHVHLENLIQPFCAKISWISKKCKKSSISQNRLQFRFLDVVVLFLQFHFQGICSQ